MQEVLKEHHTKSLKAIYLPGLNGLRAIAAIAVVFSHITLELYQFGLNSKIFGVNYEGEAMGLALAGHGVTIFFTLSGFLITYLILKEKELGKVNIKAFYVRRILRIWPLYYLYFFLVLAIIFLFSIHYPASSVPFYVFLAANVPFFLGKTLPLLAHFWSLGVEEQFYLFFPQIAKLSNVNMMKVVKALIVVFLFLKFICWILDRKYAIPLPLAIVEVTRFDTMLIGVLAAMYYYQQNKLFIQITTHISTQIIAWVCVIIITINKFNVASVIDSELICLISVALIMGQVTKRNNIINLENRVCDFVGKISFGIYVIHPLLIFFFVKLIGKFQSQYLQNYLLVYGCVLVATILVAYISYEYYEKWFLKLKSKYTTVKSRNSKD